MSELRESRTLAELLHRVAQQQPEATAMNSQRSGDPLRCPRPARDPDRERSRRDWHSPPGPNRLSRQEFGLLSRIAVWCREGRCGNRAAELAFGRARNRHDPRRRPHLSVRFVAPGFEAIPKALDMRETLHCISIDGANDEWLDFIAWRDMQSPGDQLSRGDSEDTVIQMYTSGTTGLPKGVELSNRNILAMIVAAEDGGWGALVCNDVALMCMPASHVAGTVVGLIGLAHGSTLIAMAEFDAAALVEAIPRFGVTWLVLVPAAILLLVQHPASVAANFSSVRSLIYGASPIAEALVEQARVAFRNAGLWHLLRFDRSERRGNNPSTGCPRPGTRKAPFLR